jgi:hypothetical protein
MLIKIFFFTQIICFIEVSSTTVKMSLDAWTNLSELQEKYFFRIPYAHIIADYVWPGLVMSPQRVIDIRDIKFEKDDVLLVSYPKSGKY